MDPSLVGLDEPKILNYPKYMKTKKMLFCGIRGSAMIRGQFIVLADKMLISDQIQIQADVAKAMNGISN